MVVVVVVESIMALIEIQYGVFMTITTFEETQEGIGNREAGFQTYWNGGPKVTSKTNRSVFDGLISWTNTKRYLSLLFQS